MTTPRHILLLTYGTRGDVEPFLALARELVERGHRVTIASAQRYQSWVAEHGLAFLPMTNASLDLMDTPDGRVMLEGAAGRVRRIIAGLRLTRQSGPINSAITADAWRAWQQCEPDLLIHHPKVMAAPHIAAGTGTPAIMALLQPMIVPTRAFPPFGIRPLPFAALNRAAYGLVSASHAMFKKPINRFRKEEFGLPRLRRGRDVLFPPEAPPRAILHAVSEHVIPRPADWPDHAQMTGYWRLLEPAAYKPPPALAAFLDDGPPPVYIGFGSMVSADARKLSQMVTEALARAGQRGVISTGWAALDSGEADHVITIPSVPHSWLFPRMAAVVHHGGAGTTAQGFHAGIPSIICPFLGDQPGWAARSVALGVGTDPIPRSRLNSERLATAISTAVNDHRLQQNARTLAAKLQRENGVTRAADLIEQEI